jgi:hypothetical protein
MIVFFLVVGMTRDPVTWVEVDIGEVDEVVAMVHIQAMDTASLDMVKAVVGLISQSNNGLTMQRLGTDNLRHITKGAETGKLHVMQRLACSSNLCFFVRRSNSPS